MRESTWSRVFTELSNGFNEVKNYDVEDQRVLDLGRMELKEFFICAFDTPKRPMERHQYTCIVVKYIEELVKWAWGFEFVNRHEHLFYTRCGIDPREVKNLFVTIIKRQHGKTEMLVRIFVGALLSFTEKRINDKGERNPFDLALTSFKGKHATEVFGRIITEFKKKMVNYTNFNFKFTKDKITITNLSDKTDIRVGDRYEGGISGLTGKRFVGDEYFLWTEERADRQLLPQLQVDGTCALLFTTLKGRSHWCSHFIEGRRPAAKVVNFAEVCNECLKKQPIEQLACDHIRIRVQAHWIKSSSRDLLLASMSIKSAQTEMLNVAQKCLNNLIPLEEMQSHLTQKKRSSFCSNDFISFTDPSMTSTNGSSTATVITTSQSQNRYAYSAWDTAIVYLSQEITSSPNKIANSIINDWLHFIRAWKLKPGVHMIYAFVESNTINFGEDLQQRIENNYVLSRLVKLVKAINPVKSGVGKTTTFRRYGIAKTRDMECKYIQLLFKKLYQNNLSVHALCTTRIKALGVNNFLKDLAIQCSRVKRIQVPGAIPRVESTKDESGKSCHNDLYMAFVSNLWATYLLKYCSTSGLSNQLLSRTEMANHAEFDITAPMRNKKSDIMSRITSNIY